MTFGVRSCALDLLWSPPLNHLDGLTLTKGVLGHRNKTGVFNRDGDATFSDSTSEFAIAVKDGCAAIEKASPEK